MPSIDSEAIQKLRTYAEELERDGVCFKSKFFKETYVMYALVKQHYDYKIAYQLSNLSKTITLKPNEIRGVANLLSDGVEPEDIERMAFDGLWYLHDLTEQEYQEHKAALENMQDAQMYKDKPWFADLCHLFEKGYCMPQKDNIHSIFEACGKLQFTASYRRAFGFDYIVSCREHDRYSLKRENCLLHFLEIAKAELNEYSENTTWVVPKPGFLKEWADAAFRYERVRQMINEIHHKHNDFEDTVKIYVGTINGWSIDMTHTEDPHQYVERVEFGVEYTGNPYTGLVDSVVLHINHDVGISWLISGYYDIERHKRYDEGKSTALRVYVDLINYIRKFEWIEAWKV